MKSPAGLLHYTIASVLFLALFAGNLFSWHSPFVGMALLIFFVLFYGFHLGGRISAETETMGRVLWGGAALVVLLSLYGTAAYYLDLLNQTTVAAGIILTPLLVFLLTHRGQDTTPPPIKHFSLRAIFLPILPLAILTTSALTLIINHPITSPVRSPWLVIPPIFFLAIFLIAWIVSAKPNKWLLVLFFFLTISVALLSYPLGYGFDSFIHKATEQHIFEFGTITPKPLYYVGQYALVLIAAHGFALPVDLMDSLLVPILASLLLPLGAFVGFRAWLGKTRATFASLAIFLVPLGSFIATTPQGLANIWTLLVVFSTMPLLRHDPVTKKMSIAHYGLPILFAAAALATHPLAGIPAVIYIAILFFSHLRLRTPLVLLSFFSSLSLPLVFIANATISGLAITISLKNLASTSIAELFQFSLFAGNRFHPLLDAAYLFGWNRIIFLMLLVIAGVIVLRRAKTPIAILVLPAVILLVNYVLLSTALHFDFLIDYERQNYAIRAFDTAQFFLLPILGFTLSAFFPSVTQKPLAIRFGVSLLTAAVLTSALYMTYPRHDNYEISRGFNVGTSDFDTVRYIHDQNEFVDYIVLANQAVSSAAMSEYGFLQYYNGNVFYYPIPTGGAMYQTYLAMVNTGPTKQRAVEAMDLAGVDKAYFVVNDYWFNAEKIIENAKREANDWVAIDNGATHVFVYTR